jgi:hypothetical protein
MIERVSNPLKRRQHAPRSKMLSGGMLVLYGVAAWVLYSFFKNKAAAATLPQLAPSPGSGVSLASPTQPVMIGAPSPLTPPIAITGDQLRSGMAFFQTLTPVAALPSGYIDFPSGGMVPAALMTNGLTAADASGAMFVLWGGVVYAIGQPDLNGNYPALAVGS